MLAILNNMLYILPLNNCTLFFCLSVGSDKAFLKTTTLVKQNRSRGEWCNKAIQNDFFLPETDDNKLYVTPLFFKRKY
jgi:hypothetical protein